MRALILVLLVVGCGGNKKAASAPSGGMYGGDAVAVRHRRALVWNDVVATSGSAEDPSPKTTGSDELADYQQSGTNPTGGQPGPSLATHATDLASARRPDKLVVEAYIDMRTAEVTKTVAAIRERVETGGGYIVSENISGSESAATSATLELRIPPLQAQSIASWLGTLGTLTSKRMTATEVSKVLFDQELALKNLDLTMTRLQELAAKGGAIETVLTIEKELTRVRGDIERIKGEQRYLLDRVEYATVSVSISREGETEYDLIPEARLHPGVQLATFFLIDPGMRQRTRFGAGMSARVMRALTFDLTIFPRGDGGDSRAVIGTIGTALYSGYLGYGQRRYFNPYVGARAGYGYLSGNSGFTVAAELGIEWLKHEYLVVDTSVRALAFVLEPGNQAAVQATAGVAVPF